MYPRLNCLDLSSYITIYKDKIKGKISIVLQVDEIKKIFDNVSVEDVKLLGFNPDLMQPKNLILTVFPVIPTCKFQFLYLLNSKNNFIFRLSSIRM